MSTDELARIIVRKERIIEDLQNQLKDRSDKHGWRECKDAWKGSESLHDYDRQKKKLPNYNQIH